MRIINFKFMFLVCLWMCVVACSEKDNDSFKEQLKQYLRKDLPVTTVSSDKYAAYFDFTGAMTACSDPATDSTFNGLCQKITGSSELFDIYKLGDAKITPLSGDVRPAAIFANLKSASSKTEYYAPIEETLKKITNEGRGAVLVTDFEEYTKDGQIYRQAYATPYFKKWLANGGDITFYVTDYIEGNLPKHLYYVVFDYNEHKLLNLVNDGLQGLPQNYRTFTLTANAYPITTKYLSASKGGTYHDETGDDIVSLSNEDGSSSGFFMVDSLRAESYCFGGSWEDIVKNASDQTKENGANIPFTHLFRNLFIDLSHSDSYKIDELGVKVYDIQDDFDKYIAYFEAIHNKPVVKKANGETYLDFEGSENGKPYYDEESGNLKPEFDYSKEPGKKIEILDMLDFDEDLFEDSLEKNPSLVELGIIFHKGFTGKILQQDNPNALLRIDIVPLEVEICDIAVIDSLFGWPGNDCLSASIKSTLQDMKPIGKPIYSYFVRIL